MVEVPCNTYLWPDIIFLAAPAVWIRLTGSGQIEVPDCKEHPEVTEYDIKVEMYCKLRGLTLLSV